MRMIPVIDLQGGVVVRAIGGRRHEYRPLVSRLVDSTDPVCVARALIHQSGARELYLADLDAIAGGEPAIAVYRELQMLGIHLWVDAGVHNEQDAVELRERGLEGVVIGLETLHGPVALAHIVERIGAAHAVFSLDLRDGQPLGDLAGWHERDALGIGRQAIHLGVRRLIVLDLARIGAGAGLGTETLCQLLAHETPDIEIIAGGGVGSWADLRRLESLGVGGALVASALHDGRIEPHART